MKITNQQILTLFEAIRALDGTQVLQVVDGKAVALFKGFKLANSTRWSLAQTQGKLAAALDDFNRAKSSLILAHTEGAAEISPGHPNFNHFADDLHALTQTAVDVDLKPIGVDALNFEANQVAGNEYPVAVLHALSPLLSA
jgi:hypothetical protein